MNSELTKIQVPEHFNYIGVFLTLSCNLSCEYCINHLSGQAKKKSLLPADQWIQILNRITTRPDLPISLQGGEPTIHPHFYEIVSGINAATPIDLLTNLQFDPQVFRKNVPPERFRREAKYASIRASFHPSTMEWSRTLKKAVQLKEMGYSISLNGVLHPESKDQILRAQEEALSLGLDFRTKEFLGMYKGKIHGTFLYPDAIFSKTNKHCLCKTSELLIAPDGMNYRCHHDLYNAYLPQGSLLDNSFQVSDQFKSCDKFGSCNPCDIKTKNNRFQEWGHTSVEIKVQ